ncbi:hypothetical protein [Azospirillum doebereinerae]
MAARGVSPRRPVVENGASEVFKEQLRVKARNSVMGSVLSGH